MGNGSDISAPGDTGALTRARYADLETALDYHFNTFELLALALTHSSFSGEGNTPHRQIRDQFGGETYEGQGGGTWNYQRLEFLGDRVLGLVIADALVKRFPEASEGELARRFNQLVRKETCAAVARELRLGEYIIMSQAERQSGGGRKKTILGDACEALLGAIFLDAGFDAARIVILRLWKDLIALTEGIPTDAKSALQEWAQGLQLPIPHYHEVVRAGPDHAPRFVLEVKVKGKDPARGEGKSKRAAQQAAAAAFLIREGIWEPPADE